MMKNWENLIFEGRAEFYVIAKVLTIIKIVMNLLVGTDHFRGILCRLFKITIWLVT
jgi:hypothetical protein